MKIMFFLIASASLLTSKSTYSQGRDVIQTAFISGPTDRDTLLYSWLNNQEEFRTLSKESQEVIYWVDYIRLYPRKFYDLYAESYIKKTFGLDNPYSISLKQDLYIAQPVPPLAIKKLLVETSTLHAKDMRDTHKFTHESSWGWTFAQRMRQYGVGHSSENMFNGGRTPFDAVMNFMVDDDIPSVGHRKNILDPTMRTTGACYIPYDSNSIILVEDFSSDGF